MQYSRLTTGNKRRMNLSEYASKLRTHAAAAAKKIPTFDDMAANDDYIHSDEFNVRGQSSRKKNDTSMAVSNIISRKVVDPDELSSVSSSWSLLDRPSLHRAPLVVPPTEQEIQPTVVTKTWEQQDGAIDVTNPVSANTSVSSDRGGLSVSQQVPSQRSSIASVPWLAVVTNAMEEPRDPSSTGDDTTPVDNDYDSLDSNDSVDDPILSMIRTDNTKRKVKSLPSRCQGTDQTMPSNPRRFMDDERISGIEMTQMDDELLPGPPMRDSQTQDRSGFSSPLAGLVTNFAKVQLDKFFMRRPDLTASTQTIKPPLTTERKNQKQKSLQIPVEEYHQTASSAVLCEDDLAKLSKLRETSVCGTYVLGMMNFLRENQQFAFIFFTLILAMFVFFFLQTADDVS